ncbi:hypothetical protein L226DRAFT_572371 [Lentinus tigrinus ALCF2SS1-7]|uniref:DUF6533 domain-containing protein n=1 Tax=Lentinus tigrinus ALCF2SS1-6 TaxID=1328759 RepID=A0A5C2S5R3_9APHY|nr:hypothetical protein L227DRAFT_654405 [Lentinus tigrinus ALCF2SS1-6]RPD73293.1 hypothetical protein L226DRAFT_572371 [Lentinus tigrinus ALCF2SS1-7]
MSSDEDARAAAAIVVELYNIVYTGNYCDLATSVLFIYDSVVTLEREVACFLTAERNGTSLLFLSNKVISMTFYVMQLIGFMTFPSDARSVTRCGSFSRALHAMLALQMIPWAVFSALRAYVVSRSKVLGFLVLVFSIAPTAANLVPYGYGLSGVILAKYGLGCLSTDDTTAELTLSDTSAVTIVSRAPLIAADILLIFITWTKLSSRDVLKGIRGSGRLSLSDIILRDGTIYFIVLSLLNILHLTLSLLSAHNITRQATINGTGSSFVTLFTAPITAILMSRFLLQLQEANQAVIRVDPDDPLYSSRDPYDDTPSFISSLGAFINPDLSRGDNLELSLRSHSDGQVEPSPSA